MSLHEVSWWDLEFDRAPVPFLSTAGVSQTKLVRVGMPRIPRSIINGVFYLYRNRDDALAGRNPGGTGFIIKHDGTHFEAVPGHHYYGVTNWHVAVDLGLSTIRLNKKDGTIDVIEFGPEDWHFLPGKYDVAAVPLSLDGDVHDVSSVSTHQFATSEHNDIGIGDDVFMIGLFVDHDGAGTNIPSARFGNISMLPNIKATIEQTTGYRGISYVVDMHSRTGFSGSPVYVYRTFGSDLTNVRGHAFHDIELERAQIRSNDPQIRGGSGRLRVPTMLKLLGIHWGQFPERWELRDKPKLQETRRDLIVKGAYVEGMSGMTCVIPAWQILEVLDMPELKDRRHPGIVAAKAQNAMKPKPEAAPVATDENPDHKADFDRLLTKAAKVTKGQ